MISTDKTALLHPFWVDHLNPWAFHLSNGIGIRWYGLAYMAGILIAAALFKQWIRIGRIPLSPANLDSFLFVAAVGAIVGARLGYCLFYNWSQISQDPLETFAVWHGGMSSHGGILGLILCVWIFAIVHKYDPWVLLDAVATAGPIGIALGRVANFMNGELWGRPTLVRWAVIFPRAPLVAGIMVPRHPSQLYAAVLEGILVFAVAQWVFRHQFRSGLTLASVCVTYGIGRIVDEFWREPDLGQPVYWHWMSKGQLFTLPLLAAGVLLVIYRTRSMKIDMSL